MWVVPSLDWCSRFCTKQAEQARGSKPVKSQRPPNENTHTRHENPSFELLDRVVEETLSHEAISVLLHYNQRCKVSSFC